MVRCVYGSKKLVFPLFPMPCVFCNPAQNRLDACMFPTSLFALFYHLSSEFLIYPTASFNRLKSKDDAVFYPVFFFCIFCILFFFPKEIMSTSVILAHSSTQERLQILSNNLCLSTTCCQEQKEQSNVPDDYSLAEVLVHLLQSNLYS